MKKILTILALMTIAPAAAAATWDDVLAPYKVPNHNVCIAAVTQYRMLEDWEVVSGASYSFKTNTAYTFTFLDRKITPLFKSSKFVDRSKSAGEFTHIEYQNTDGTAVAVVIDPVSKYQTDWCILNIKKVK